METERGGSQFETSKCNAGTPVAVHGRAHSTTSVRSGAAHTYHTLYMYLYVCWKP